MESELGKDTWQIFDKEGEEVAKLQEPHLHYSLTRKWLFPFLPQTYHLELINDKSTKLIIKQTWTPVILRYKVYSSNYRKFTKQVPQKLLVACLCTIAAIEGRE